MFVIGAKGRRSSNPFDDEVDVAESETQVLSTPEGGGDTTVESRVKRMSPEDILKCLLLMVYLNALFSVCL